MASCDAAPYPRSVKQYKTQAEVEAALAESLRQNAAAGCGCHRSDPPDADAPEADEPETVPWRLPTEHFDAARMRAHTIQTEAERLMVLKSLLALDETGDEGLDRLTSMAARLYGVPYCLVSLIDISRLWFLSNTGLGECRSINRLHSLCEYAIQHRGDTFMIPDTTQDAAFRSNPIVTGPPHVRFYAAAPLVVDGHCIANFCLLDTTARPAGLSPPELETLRDFSRLAMKILVDRRFRLQTRRRQERLVAAAAHDLMTPLTGLTLSLSVLREDAALARRLDAAHVDLLHTASTCGDLVSRICVEAMDGLKQGIAEPPEGAAAVVAAATGAGAAATGGTPPPAATATATTLRLDEFVARLDHILRPLRTHVPLLIAVDRSAPDAIVCDDLRVLRAALSLLASAAGRTAAGAVRFRVFCPDTAHMTFECADTAAPGLDAAAARAVLDGLADDDAPAPAAQPPDEAAASLAFLQVAGDLVRELGGTIGVRHREEEAFGEGGDGSVVWFTIPMVNPTWSVHRQSFSRPAKQQRIVDDCSCSDESTVLVQGIPVPEQIQAAGTLVELEPGCRRPMALVVDDSVVIRKTLSRVLSKLGYNVVTAEDGLQGLQELKKNLFDMVFMDFLMPNLDGLDCIRQYRDWENTNRPEIRLYIIGISGHASDKDVEKGADVGMDIFRAKPITLQTLKEIAESDDAKCHSRHLDAFASKSASTSGPHAYGFITPEQKTSTDKASGVSEGGKSWQLTEKQCLVVSPVNERSDVAESARILERNGWKTSTTANSEEALKLLKSRNWGAVLFDEKLRPASGPDCIALFRKWENEKRVHAQKNVFMLCSCNLDCPSPIDRASLIPPTGFQGVLKLPFPWKEFEYLVAHDNQPPHFGRNGMDFIMR